MEYRTFKLILIAAFGMIGVAFLVAGAIALFSADAEQFQRELFDFCLRIVLIGTGVFFGMLK